MPGIQSLYSRYRDQGLEVLGVSLDSEAATAHSYAEKEGIRYPVGLPTSQECIRQYGASAIPHMVLVDRKGMIRWSKTGYSPAVEADLEKQVQRLLAEPR